MICRPVKFVIFGAVLAAAGATTYLVSTLRAQATAGNSNDDGAGFYTLKGDVIEARDSAATAAGVRTVKADLTDAPMTLTLTAKSGLNMETLTHVSPQFAGKVVDISVGLGDKVQGPE